MPVNLQIPPDFDDAPKEERIAFVEELWNRIAEDPSIVPLPIEHKRILDERLDAYEKTPKAGTPWADVRDNLLKKLRSS